MPLSSLKKATKVTPEKGYTWNTLGVAHYRAGSWQAAIDALQKSNRLYEGGFDSVNGFFISMAHWQLGQQDEARKHYQKSIDWMNQHKPNDGMRIRFRAEAEQLLEIPAVAPKPKQ